MSNTPLVSIIILNLNRKRDLIECLDTVLNQDYPNFEDRIIFNFELGPISLEDTKGMIQHRISVTGGEKRSLRRARRR